MDVELEQPNTVNGMLFNSYIFIWFFIGVYLLYAMLPQRGQNVLLLLASYVFYAAWDWRFCSLLLLSTVVDYFIAGKISKTSEPRSKKNLLLISIVVNLGVLFGFKYFGFFYDSLVTLGAVFGWNIDSLATRIILPVGISFYTFQTLSYTIDVYRGETKPSLSVLDFSLYVAFFPQLVAGPIERSSRLLPQIQARRMISYAMIREGAWLILFGYYKKVVLADNVAPFVNLVFGEPAAAHGLGIPVAVLAFAIQIYGDFSGYTDIARGISRLMGFELMENFRMPYFALSPKQFWQRWHISLSTWLRDYLYRPLGGNRLGLGRMYVNLMLTMILGGLWHGAAWNFVLWGVYQGVLLVVYRVMRWEEPLGRMEKQSVTCMKAIAWGVFMVLVGFGWCLFRVESISDVSILFVNSFTGPYFTGKVALLTILIYATPVALIDLLQEKKQSLLAIKQLPGPVRYFVYLSLFSLIVISGVGGGGEFIYFQF